MTRAIVLLTSFIIFIVIMVWDAYLYADSLPNNSITQSVIYYSHSYPLLPWVIGYLMGFLTAHFFDTTKHRKD